jgi:hypothetical protein
MSNHTNSIPVYEGEELDPEDVRLMALFDEIKKNQLTFLDEAGKRIIELSSALLGLIFGVVAFGKDFPPPYLKGQPVSQGLAIGVLMALVLAILFGVLTVQPRNYPYNAQNLTSMREQFSAMHRHKSFWMIAATWAFFIGALLLALLIGVLVRSA